MRSKDGLFKTTILFIYSQEDMKEIGITVNLFAGLGNTLPEYDIQRGLELSVSPRTSVHDLLNSFNISYRKISLVIVNGNRKSLSTRLQNGDTVDLFPPVGGG